MNIKKRITAFIIAFFIAVSPFQHMIDVLAADKEADTGILPEDAVFEDIDYIEGIKTVKESMTAEDGSDPDMQPVKVSQDIPEDIGSPSEVTEDITADALPDTDIEEKEEDITQIIDAEDPEATGDASGDEPDDNSEVADDNGSETEALTEDGKDGNGIVKAASADDYFRMISVFPGCERIIVDTYEDLSFIEVSYGVYFDGTYILGFENGDTLDKAIDILADMGLEYAVDGTLSVCGSIEDSPLTVSVNPDADVKVAVIDTGSDLANESYSVIGDDVSDHNGHGTDMCNSILSETGNAYIISIKAIGDDGKGNISDVYVAVQMAEELGVDYILMAISVRNTGRYDAFISLIENTKARVVASAGNNGTDAVKYLPAGIEGVITVGALGKDGTLLSSSNYGDTVEYYVPAGSTSEAASKALGMMIDGRGQELPDGYKTASDDTGADNAGDENGEDPGDASDRQAGKDYQLTVRADDEDVKFVTDNVHDSGITVYQVQIYHQSDYFSHPYNDGFGVYSDKNSGSSFSWDSHILYCIEDTKDIPDDLGYGDRLYYGPAASDSDMKVIQAACAFGPAGELYEYAVQWWKEHDTGNEIFSSVKNDPQLMRRAMYAVTHFVVCKAYEGKWPASTPGDSDSVPKVFVDYYNYLKSVRSGNTVIPGYSLSGWWCELYRCNSFSDASDNNAYQLMTRGNAVRTASAPVEFKIGKTSSSAVDPGYPGFAGTAYTLYGAFPPSTITQSDYVLRDEVRTFIMKDDGTTDSSFQTTVNGTKTYYLKETGAAAGYALDDTVYWISISSDGNVSAGVMESYMSGSQKLWREINDPGKVTVTGSTVSIIRVKDHPDRAVFSLDKKLGGNYAELSGQDYDFELWDNTSDIRVATGKASVPSGANGSTAVPVIWSGIADGYSAGPDNGLFIIPGHSYQVMETSLTVNGAALDTPSGWTKGTAHGRTCFYQTFTAGAGKVHELVIANNGSGSVKLGITKNSSNTGITGKNSCYSIAGTKYVLAADSGFSSSGILGYLTVKSDGTADNSFTVTRGKTYFLKETEAGKGYRLDTSVYKIVINADGTASVSTYSGKGTASVTNGDPVLINVKDEPETAPFNITLKKTDKNGNTVHNADLTGAVFRISYYASDLGTSGSNNADAAVIYNVTLKGDHAVISLSDLRTLTPAGGSDPSYLKDLPAGLTGFPYGTVRIQEITAPAGYRLNDQVIRYRLGNSVTFSVENNSAYGNRNYWKQLSDGTLELTELPKTGYYELTKSLDDDTVRKDLSGFEYQIWNMSSSSSPVQIASGVSRSDGRVLWTYTVPDYYQNTDPSKLLTGTATYRIELPASEKNGSGAEVPVRYQVREMISSMNVSYGSTGIPYTFAAPMTSGKAWSKADAYYYKDITVSDEKVTREDVTNDYLFTGISVNKAVPADNPFDITKVSFKVYNTDGGKDTLIANGSVDSKGNVTWHQMMSQGNGGSSAASVNVLGALPLGHYRVEEIWKKEYVDAESIRIPIVEKNNSGWKKAGTDSEYVYYSELDLSSPENDGKITALSVENEKEVQEFNLVKNVSTYGDASAVTAKLYLINGGSETLVATGTAKTEGKGSYGFIWDYKGEHTDRDGLDTLVLPVGKYRIAESCPVTYYKDSKVPYTYMTPEGFTSRTSGDELQFYRDFELRSGGYETETLTVTNVRIEGSFDIIKIEHSGDGLPKTFVFGIYYGGNGEEASSDPVLIDTVEITASEGRGSVTLDDLPEGWYEIREETEGSSWTTRWLNGDGVSGGNKTIRLDSDNRTRSVLTADDGAKENGNAINAVVVYNELHPSIRTSLTGAATKDHVAAFSDKSVLEDVVSYTSLMPGHYVITGVLIDKSTGKELLDSDGNIITGSRSFDVYTVIDGFGGVIPQSGSVKITYTLDTTCVKDVTVVAFEELRKTSASGDLVASHKDINDAGQTVYIPGVRTTLTDPVTESHVAAHSDTVVLEDAVSYSNLMPGKDYTLSGELFDKTTGRSLGIKAVKTFTPSSSNGIEKVTFTADTALVKGTSVVAFETLSYNGTDIAVHADINDADQTVSVPDIKTTIAGADTKDQVAGYNTVEKLVDTVTYKGLVPGRTYEVEGTLVDKATGEPLGITGSASFTAESSDGSIDVLFSFDSTVLAGKTVVAFETLRYEGTDIAVHADIDDRDQTVYVPEIGTTFVDRSTEEHIAALGEKATLVDTVFYNNLVAGKEYTLTGTLMDKKTGRELTDGNGNVYTSTKTFTPGSESGTVDIGFVIDTSVINGVTIVAFEKMYHKDVLIAVHADIGDEDQTVYVPKIRTTLKDTVTSEHIASEETVTLTDTVRYTDLIPGRDYTVKGVLVNRDTGEKLLDENGHEITSSVSFTAERSEGSEDIVFTFSSRLLKGRTVVAFEDLYCGGIKVASHADISDEEQTVYFPEIHTTLIDMNTDKHVSARGGKIKLKDTVSYSGLKTGCSYTLKGTLYVQSTKEVLTDPEGNPVASETEFVPDGENGFADLVFEFDAAALKGESLVAFEELYFKDNVVASHNDINDRGQTVDIPDIRTSFFDSAFGPDSDLVRCDTEVELTDRVFYKNLTPGLEYSLYMTVMVKDTGEPLPDNEGKPVAASMSFVPESLEGFVDISVNVDTALPEGVSLVAFEALDHDGINLVIHADIEDKDQTLDIPKIRTLAADADNNTRTLTYKEKVNITDNVSYENLVIGKTYKITGTIYDKGTGEVYTDAEGRSYKAEKEFTAEKTSGVETVVFTDVPVPFSKTELVIFEDLTDKDTGIRLAAHADLEDEDQTVRRPDVYTTATILNSKEIWLESAAATDITVSDHVYYEGFEPGRIYRAEATLFKTDGTQIMSGGKPVMNIVEFSPSSNDGDIIVDLTFSSEGMAEGDRVVVFEKFYDIATEEELSTGVRTQDILISRHEDLKNDSQTVDVHFRPQTGGIKPSYSVAGNVIAVTAFVAASVWFVISRKKTEDGD